MLTAAEVSAAAQQVDVTSLGGMALCATVGGLVMWAAVALLGELFGRDR